MGGRPPLRLASGLQEGGVESAFHKTSPGATAAPIKKLYQVKGKKNIRATERALSWDSFNTGDCFILDLGPVSRRPFKPAGTGRLARGKRPLQPLEDISYPERQKPLRHPGPLPAL